MKEFIFTIIYAVGFIYISLSICAALQYYKDVTPFNNFAAAYNDYTSKPGVNDVKKLNKMLNSWHKLAKDQGWKENCKD